MIELDPVFWARIQFAFTISFHIIFPAFTIGLASYLTVIEWRWLKTGNILYRDLYKFWVKIFAVAFGMGVVSGVVMSYQFGTNWSVFSDKVANVIGPLLGFEVLTAFFLEASFLGIMLFGWEKVSAKMHFFSTCTVAIGTLISAFWILSANSWMHTPQGYEIAIDGRLMPINWLEIIFNPSFPFRYAHMVTAAYLTTAFFVGGVGALYLLQKRFVPEAKVMLCMATLMAALVAPLQLLIGHAHGENTMHYQPVKVAAMEGNWDQANNAPLYLFGWPDQKNEETKYGITIPGGASWVLTGNINGEIPMLKSFSPTDRPPVVWVFWSFRVMVGLGLLMITVGLVTAIQYFRKRIFEANWLHVCWIAMMPSGFIALLAGWFVTEIGRQPWTAYGLIRTIHSVSPAILGPQVAWSFFAFVILYTFIFGAGSYYIFKLIKKGLPIKEEIEQFYAHGMEAILVEKTNHKGEKNV